MLPFSGPAEVKGKLENIRNVLQAVLILIFIMLPWARLNGEPFLLLDVFNRHFIIFGVSFFSHDAPLLFFVLILVLLSIFIVTALFGRLWCGWSCPQSVFLHAVFNRIERIILGNYSKRIKLFSAEIGGIDRVKIFLIYIIFFAISSLLAHSFVAYFLGSSTVTAYIADGPSEHIKAFGVVSIMSLVLFLNFTFFREKLCFFVCPYGRFQNALIDNNSLTVFYDKIRGEPRGKIKTGLQEDSEKGDCIDCNRCVRVCPTKIDIRNGFQLECIACGKCIDACNEVMQKVGRPERLIRYETGNQKKINLNRFRLYLYGALFLVFISAFSYLLLNRTLLDVSISRAHSAPFSSRQEGEVKVSVNQIQLHLKNNSIKNLAVVVKLSEKDLKSGFKVSTPAANLVMHPSQDLIVPAFVELADNQSGSAEFTLEFVYGFTDAPSANMSTSERSFKFIKGN